jgi:hypothetical protein
MLVTAILAMIVVAAALTLHTMHLSALNPAIFFVLLVSILWEATWPYATAGGTIATNRCSKFASQHGEDFPSKGSASG